MSAEFSKERLQRFGNLWQAAVALELPLFELFNNANIVVYGDVEKDHQIASAHDRYSILYNRVYTERATESDIQNIELVMRTLSKAIADNVSETE